jgi:2'-phosphotransferase
MSGFQGQGRKGKGGNSKAPQGGWQASGKKKDARTNKKGDLNYTISRKLSNLLRHRVHHNGLTDCLRTDGYVPLDRVLALPSFEGRTVEQIREVVADNDKQRFSLVTELVDLTPTLFIRANQGHSIEGINSDELLTPIVFAEGDGKQLVAVHGTYHKAWPAILQSQGLCRMTRQHVHLAADLPGESGVISGMRGSCELVVHVDVREAVLGGLAFYTSANGVILTPGLGDAGMLPLTFVTKVEDRAGNIIYPAPSTTT